MKTGIVLLAVLALGACSSRPPVAHFPQPLTQDEQALVAQRNAATESKAVRCDNWCRDFQFNRAMYQLENAPRVPIIVPIYIPVYTPYRRYY